MGFGKILWCGQIIWIVKLGKVVWGRGKGSYSHHKHQVSVVPWRIVLLREPTAQTLQRLSWRFFPIGAGPNGYFDGYWLCDAFY